MAINLSGQAIQDVRVAGVQAQRVMLGTGSTAVEVWSASPYPLTGTWGPLTVNEFNWVTRASHTITESGKFTITHTGTIPLGATVNVVTPAGTVTGDPSLGGGGTSTATITVTLSAGDVVQFQTNGGYSLTASGTWSITKIPLPVVTITGTSGYQSRDQFRAACTQYGVDYATVQELPFLLDTSRATHLASLFFGCSSLITVPDLDTSKATSLAFVFYGCSSLIAVPDLDASKATSTVSMFNGCSSLTDGNVRLIGKHPSVTTSSMIANSGLTRLPFYDTNGNPI